MGKYFKETYFTKAEIDRLIDAYVQQYPDAIETMKKMMTDDSRSYDEERSLHFNRVREVARGMEFFHDYAKRIPRESLKDVPDPYYHADYHINHDLSMRVRDMLEGIE